MASQADSPFPEQHPSPGQQTRADRTRTETLLAWLMPLLVLALAATAFWPAINGKFLDWDDDKLLVNNPDFRGLAPDNLRWMFTTNLLGHYQPVNWVSFGVDYCIWGTDPRGYHRTNIILFALSAWVFYRIALRLLARVGAEWSGVRHTGLILAAGLTALLYAVHPLRVESVAWITGRAYVLSGLFFMLTILLYLRFAERRAAGRGGWAALILAVLCYTLSVFSRANAVALPFVLLLLDIYPLRRLGLRPADWIRPDRRHILLEKIPFLVVAVVAAALAQWAKTAVGTVASVSAIPIAARVAMGVYSLAFYLLKTIWPTGLLPLYEKPFRLDPFELTYLLAGLFVVAVTAVLYVLRRRWTAGWILWLYYLLMVAPVSGLVQIGVQLAADRYTQLACLGWTLLAGAGFLYCWSRPRSARTGRTLPVVVIVLSLAVVVTLTVASRRQSRVWLDRETLWRTTLAGDPTCLTALNNLTALLAQSGRRDEALEYARAAERIEPTFPGIQLNLGSLNLEAGEPDVAIHHFENARRYGLETAEVYSNLGVAWARKGDPYRALQYLEHAVSLPTRDAESFYNLGIVYAQLNRLSDAEQAFLDALRLRPDHANAAHNLAVVRRRMSSEKVSG